MEHLRERRAELVTEAEAISKAAEAGKRAFNDEEIGRLDEIQGELERVERSIDATSRVNETRARSAENLAAAQVATAPTEPTEVREESAAPAIMVRKGDDPGHYRRGPKSESWFTDLARMSAGDRAASQRLQESNKATLEMMPAEKRDLYTASTTGQELVPPIFLQDMFQAKHEAAAVVSSLVTRHDIPAIGRSVSIPKQTGSAAVGITAEATPLSALTETDAAFASADATVYMVSGLQDLSLQLAERSQPGADAVMIAHFGALLGAFEDSMVINGSNSGQPKGILNATGIQAVTYTDESGTLAEVYPKLADLQQQIETEHFLPLSAWVVHPRRAAAWMSELASSRPLITPSGVAQNPLAVGGGANVAAGYTGYNILGVPVYKAAKMPTTLGGTTQQDAVIGGDLSACHLWLSPPIFEVDRSVNFKTGGVAVRARQYMAFTAEARPDAVGKITGSGFNPPSF